MIRGKGFHRSLGVLLVLGAFLLTSMAWAHSPAEPDARKTGILLVAFGTSDPDAKVSFEKIDQLTRATHPDIPVRWAYTSHLIRHKLDPAGNTLLSPLQALAKMADEGFTDVAVQSLHTIPGKEFEGLAAAAHSMEGIPGGLRRVSIGLPLLAHSQDLEAAADAMIASLPRQCSKDDAVVLLGHGTHHPADVYYAAMQHVFTMKSGRILLGTVEGAIDFEQVLKQLQPLKPRRVFLLPFMSVAGDHAKNDMAGEEDDSWASMLRGKGFEVVPVLHGTAEYPAVARLWLEHLQAALENLNH